ncbi:hypothetical protein [Algoriphagus sp.]|uniref:hypothetical protein n=1 Tax=Algoriphagus sp. TaxID=1872435 RepID=UPI0026197B3F|nr:hypothetical protein [Algoriphagus sp.]
MRLEKKETSRSMFSAPGLEEVKCFFASSDFPSQEGEVFYFYYQALGWRTESGSPIYDWKALASQWVWNLEN